MRGNMKQIYEQFKTELPDSCVPFWLEHGADNEPENCICNSPAHFIFRYSPLRRTRPIFSRLSVSGRRKISRQYSRLSASYFLQTTVSRTGS